MMALLSDATLIVEATATSGTRHQGWEAIRLGRPVLFPKRFLRGQSPAWADEVLRYGAFGFDAGTLPLVLDDLPTRCVGSASRANDLPSLGPWSSIFKPADCPPVLPARHYPGWQCPRVAVRRRGGDVRPSLSRMNETLMSPRGLIGVYWGVLLGISLVAASSATGCCGSRRSVRGGRGCGGGRRGRRGRNGWACRAGPAPRRRARPGPRSRASRSRRSWGGPA